MSDYDIFHYLLPGGAAALGPLALLFVRFMLYPHYAGKAQGLASPLGDEVSDRNIRPAASSTVVARSNRETPSRDP